MSYEVKYPIDFRSGGDTVSQGIWKIIEELKTIYGILNELAGNDLTDEELSSLQTGAIDGQRITGHVGGYISGTQIHEGISGAIINGVISAASIPYGNVTGLTGYIDGKLASIGTGSETVSDKGDGITASNLSADGYAKFNNGLIVQWGVVEVTMPSNASVTRATAEKTFPIKFPTKCFSVSLTPIGATAAYLSSGTTSTTVLQEKFTVIVPTTDSVGASTGLSVNGTVRVYFMAIGV